MANKSWQVLLLILIIGSTATGGEIKYFDSKIDFWNTAEATSPNKSEPSLKQEAHTKSDFPWKTYLDPKNKEFFKEGDYTPPEPFMEVARNPNDDNIKQWMDFIRMKNEIASRLQIRMAEYVSKNKLSIEKTEVPEKRPAVVKEEKPLDPARFKFRMYFDSNCPHCKKMFGVLRHLKEQGFSVEALQVDKEVISSEQTGVTTIRADRRDLEKHGVKGVPFLLIADSKRQVLLPPVEGYHDFDEIMELVKGASRL